MKGLIAKVVAFFNGDLVQKIVKCIPAIVAEVEKAMVDGKIDASERKALALKVVDIVAEKFNVKLNFFAKWAISALIDAIAKKLPSKDIIVPDVVLKIVKEW